MSYKVSFQSKEEEKNWIGITTLASLTLSSLTLLATGFLFVNTAQIVNKETPRLVELKTGETMKVRAIGALEREPQTIKHFTLETFKLMFTWTGHIKAGNKSIPDPGVKLNSSGLGRLPTAAWQSSFALSSDFRADFLKYLSQIAPTSQIFSDKIDVLFVPLNIQDPIQLEEGHWQVNLVSNLLIVRGNETLRIVPFNKKIFVRAVIAPEYQAVPKNEAHSAIVGIVSAIRQLGLEIERIEDLNIQSLNNIKRFDRLLVNHWYSQSKKFNLV